MEGAFEAAKQEVGLADYEVRSWTGWHRHVTLALLAHAVLAAVRELADEAGVPVTQVPDPQVHPWLSAMFAYYDRHGLPVGTRVMSALLR